MLRWKPYALLGIDEDELFKKLMFRSANPSLEIMWFINSRKYNKSIDGARFLMLLLAEPGIAGPSINNTRIPPGEYLIAAILASSLCGS
jgi:hypothetical protein